MSGFDANATNPLQSQLPQGGRDDQPGDRPAARSQRRTALREPRRPGVAVQDRLEQHPAARRLHLPGQRLAGRARQLRPLVPRPVERRPERRLHDRLPADDAVHREGAERRRSGDAVGEPVPGRLPAAARRRAGAADRARHRPDDPESRLRDSLHRSVDGRRRHPAAVEHRARRRLRRQPGEQARRHPQRQLGAASRRTTRRSRASAAIPGIST